jgi:nitrite reductase (NADH) large subunit
VLIVVGNGTSGRKFLASASQHHLTDRYRIRALDERANGAQQRDVAGLTPERETVLAVDPLHHILKTASGRMLAYDALVLATGARASVPESVSVHPNCFVYRAPSDLSAIRRAAKGCRRGVVLGGGRHGLQAAELLRGLGLETHIVEPALRLLSKWVDDTGAIVLHSRIAGLGIELHLGLALSETLASEGRLTSVRLTDGSEIAADLVILCPGTQARDELGRASGLKLGSEEGIAIDERCQTSDEDVLAVGSVASFKGHCLNWPAARGKAAETAVRVLGGERVSLRSLEPVGNFRVLGVGVASFGDAFGRAADTVEISIFDGTADTYARLNVGRDGTKLVGGILVGNVRHYAELYDFYARGVCIPKQPGYLVQLLSGGNEKTGAGVLSSKTQKRAEARV